MRSPTEVPGLLGQLAVANIGRWGDPIRQYPETESVAALQLGGQLSAGKLDAADRKPARRDSAAALDRARTVLAELELSLTGS
jgi:hypothetical protein